MLNWVFKNLNSFTWPFIMVLVLITSFFIQFTYLSEYLLGVIPLDYNRIGFGILYPLFHQNIQHLMGNILPLFLSSIVVFHYFNWRYFVILGIIWVVSFFSIFYLGSPNTIHIGASGLVYGMVTYVISLGIITKARSMLAYSFLFIFLYGSLIWGIFPESAKLLDKKMSWEGHLGGVIGGIIAVVLFVKHSPKEEKIEWNDDEELLDESNPYWLENDSNTEINESEKSVENSNQNINYIYIEKSNDKET